LTETAELSEIAGVDAFFLHMERPDTPCHTLKVVTLDPRRLGRQIELADLVSVIPRYLGVSPRLTHRVERSGRRLFWAEAAGFDVREHLDEVDVLGGGPDALDAVCATLATAQLDRSRPLWAITLVHGLAHGRQAAVLRIHHALMDGLASVNTLTALTTDQPGLLPTPRIATSIPKRSRAPLGSRLVTLARAARASRRLTRSFPPVDNVPSGLVPRTRFNTPSGAARVCASGSIPFADLKALGESAGTTVNGALHAVIAHAMRTELEADGQLPNGPLVATFGVADDPTSTRTDGNRIATARVWLHSHLTDPLSMLHRTGNSCTQSVALRRRRGFALQVHAMEVVDRLAPMARDALAVRIPNISNHITTANVPGPRSVRWFGDVEVCGWTSYSLAVAPADVSLTAYSYAGRMWFGLVSTPESMPRPAAFLARLEQAVERMLDAARPQAAMLTA
jgi:WS/DGAT/MGAT family acyltransferase